jgi:hypothetical protein
MKKILNEGNKIHNFISSSGSGTVINYGSGSDFLTSYGSGSTTVKINFLLINNWCPDQYYNPKKRKEASYLLNNGKEK